MQSAAAVPDARPGMSLDRPSWPDVIVDSIVSRVRAPRLWQWVWAAFVVLMSVSGVLFGRAHVDELQWVAVPLAAVAIAPLVVVRRWPAAALSLVIAANSAFVVVARFSWPPTAVVAWLFALAATPLVLSRRPAIGLLIFTELAVVAGACVPGEVNARPWDAPLTEALAAIVMWGAAEVLRARREAQRERAVAASQLRAVQQREAVALGRAEIARELHDVVAHHVSLIAVRAAMAPYQLDDPAPGTLDVLAEIAAEARTALDELRTVLGVLRVAEVDAPQTPQPSLAELPDLVDRMRVAGMSITMDTQGVARALPPNVELCCYRVVQEALTNAARHAPGAAATVLLTYHRDGIGIEVTNAGGVVPATADLATPGYGLIGMRERVTALGGRLRADQHGLGFGVDVQIPVTTAGGLL